MNAVFDHEDQRSWKRKRRACLNQRSFLNDLNDMGYLGGRLDMLITSMPKVKMKSMSQLGLIEVEFGRAPAKMIKGSDIPLCSCSHSMEYFFCL